MSSGSSCRLLGIGLYGQTFQLGRDPMRPFLVWLLPHDAGSRGSACGPSSPRSTLPAMAGGPLLRAISSSTPDDPTWSRSAVAARAAASSTARTRRPHGFVARVACGDRGAEPASVATGAPHHFRRHLGSFADEFRSSRATPLRIEQQWLAHRRGARAVDAVACRRGHGYELCVSALTALVVWLGLVYADVHVARRSDEARGGASVIGAALVLLAWVLGWPCARRARDAAMTLEPPGRVGAARRRHAS